MIIPLNFKLCPKIFCKSFDGFTLLEVVLALMVIAIALPSIISFQGRTISLNESSRFYSTAPFLAQSKISEVIKDPMNAASSSGDFGSDQPGYTWNTEIEPVNINVFQGAKFELKNVRVTVEFNEGEMKYTLQQYFNVATSE